MQGNISNHPKGKYSHNWKGGTRKQHGYIQTLAPGHPKIDPNGYVPIQIIVAEKALGKYLPKTAIVHHINHFRSDNRNENLIVCQDHAYHRILHRREIALQESGNAVWRKCGFCKQYDDPKNLYIHYPVVIHKECNKIKAQKLRDGRKQNGGI